jgi:hypothetical protein
MVAHYPPLFGINPGDQNPSFFVHHQDTRLQ